MHSFKESWAFASNCKRPFSDADSRVSVVFVHKHAPFLCLGGQTTQQLTQICVSSWVFTSPWSPYLDVTEMGASTQCCVCPLKSSSAHNKSHTLKLSGAFQRWHTSLPGSVRLSCFLCFHWMKAQQITKHMSPRWHLYPFGASSCWELCAKRDPEFTCRVAHECNFDQCKVGEWKYLAGGKGWQLVLTELLAGQKTLKFTCKVYQNYAKKKKVTYLIYQR